MTAILFLFMMISAFAQEFQYRLEGSFVSGNSTVNYFINWNETDATIQGLYQDNLLARGPKLLSGSVTVSGRTMSVILPEDVLGVRSISLETPVSGDINGSVPVNIKTSDSIGRVIGSARTFAMVTKPFNRGAQSIQNTNQCTVGFGALTGFCGIYEGSMNEIYDNRQRCDLVSGGNYRLELAADTVFRLYLNYIPGLPVTEFHNIGAFLPSPTSNTINITGRNCSVLPGTTFIPNNCKTINLNGVFLNQISNISFTGTYTISDEVTADTCSYSLMLHREIVY